MTMQRGDGGAWSPTASGLPPRWPRARCGLQASYPRLAIVCGTCGEGDGLHRAPGRPQMWKEKRRPTRRPLLSAMLVRGAT